MIDVHRRAQLTADLALAEQHIAEGHVRIAKQLKLIAELERDGHKTDDAKELLTTLHETQRAHQEHRASILSQLDGH